MRVRFTLLMLCLSVVLLAISAAGCRVPLPFMSGGALPGPDQPAPATWSLEEDFGVVQLETRPEAPYSVNIAYTLLAGTMYINAGDTETEWVKHIAANPHVRLRMENTIYALRAERVVDRGEISAFADAWTSHSMFHRDPFELEEVWIYRLKAR